MGYGEIIFYLNISIFSTIYVHIILSILFNLKLIICVPMGFHKFNLFLYQAMINK